MRLCEKAEAEYITNVKQCEFVMYNEQKNVTIIHADFQYCYVR
jgi:hypothetical protein